jgi:hypothetical protein
MRRRILCCVLAGMLLAVAACGASPQQDHGGWVGMLSFTDPESGIRGLTPMDGWSNEAQLVQDSAPVGIDGLRAELLKQTDLDEVPPPVGTLRGRGFSWDLFSFDCHLPDLEPMVRVKLAQAEGESASYFVVLAVLPEAYEANPSLYDTVFRHAVYALEPLE